MVRKKELTTEEIAAFCRQMEIVLKSGLSYGEGLEIIAMDTKKGALKGVAEQLLTAIETMSFSQGVEMVGMFPRYFVKMVNIGEITGRLDDVMHGLTMFYQRRQEVERSIRSAVVFPLIMAMLMFGVILALVIKVMPTFYQILQSFAGGLSPFAAGMLKIGTVLSDNITVVLLIIAAVLTGLLIINRVPASQHIGVLLRAKLFKGTTKSVAVGCFSAAMSMMLKSGMDIDEALKASAETVEYDELKKDIAILRAKFQQGESFSQAAMESGVFTNVQGAIISLGAKTGNLDVVMEYMAEQYNTEAEDRISVALSVVEPVIVAVFSILLALILLSVILPLMGVMTSL